LNKKEEEMKRVDIIVVGAGMRGLGYIQFAKHFPERCRVVGVAEPREWYRNKVAKEFDVPKENVFESWEDLVATGKKLADAVLLCTQDHMHVEPAEALAALKYDILLEKPMAPTPEGCRRIVDAAKKHEIILSVCLVLRYTTYTKELKKILDSGRIGEIVSIQHHEPVGYWHQAHSFVRGNWRNEAESSFMLLAKACHDMDWIRYIADKPVDQISSFGSLRHFKKSEQPHGASDRCLTCPTHIEARCAFSAKKIYYGFLNSGNCGWPVDVLTPEVTPESLEKALQDGPYGRCVYACDNDVVDNQVVNIQFKDGATATFSMTAFTKAAQRKTSIFGTKGEIYGDGKEITIFDFLTDKTEVIDTSLVDDSVLAGHGGGDGGIMDNFISAVAVGDPNQILSGPEVSLETHLMAFLGEKSRKDQSVERVTL
jgi:predicted dehydrogenase